MILYLPRSTPPEITVSASDVPQWETVPIVPKYSRPDHIGEEAGLTNPSEAVNVS